MTRKNFVKHFATAILCTAALFTGAKAVSVQAKAAETPAAIQQAAAVLSERGVYQGDASGNLNLDKGLTRAELAAILTRVNGETNPSAFDVFCYFKDVPDWAKTYVGYNVQWGFMQGYDAARFGPNDAVNPQMACTVVLRRSDNYEIQENKTWTYNTASQYAASLGWISPSTASAKTITRGEMAVLLSRASGWLDTSAQEQAPVTVPVESQVTAPTTTPATVPASQEAFEITADGQYICHADHWSREDFSQQANPAVFTDVYTREVYNAIRQTLIDGEAGVQPAFTAVSQENRSEVERMLSNLSGGICYYEKFTPQNFTNRHEHPNYFAVSPRIPENRAEPQQFVDSVIDQVKMLASDQEKVTYLNDYLCSLLAYDYEDYSSAGIAEIFAPHNEEAKGTCGSYTYAMQFLCDMADIPCIGIVSDTHAWNMVYADGQWLHVDVTANDGSMSKDSVLLVKNRSDGYSDSYPEITAFIQELLVPGSSAK